MSAARGQFPVKARDNLSKGKAPGFCIRGFFNEFLLQWLKKCSSNKRFKNANKLITNGSPAVRFTEFRKGPFGSKRQSEHSNWHVNAVTDHGEDGKGNLEKEILIQASLVKD